MWKIRHTTVIDWGWGGVGSGELRGGVEVGGVGSGGLRSGELGRGIGVGGSQFSPTPLTPNLRPQPHPQPNPQSTPPDFNPPNPNPPDPTPTYHRCVANLPHRHCCKRLSDAYAQILGHIRTRMSHPLCGESSLWRIFCGESSGNRLNPTLPLPFIPVY